jgi:transposase
MKVRKQTERSAKVFELHNKGMKQTDIAVRFGVHKSTILRDLMAHGYVPKGSGGRPYSGVAR